MACDGGVVQGGVARLLQRRPPCAPCHRAGWRTAPTRSRGVRFSAKSKANSASPRPAPAPGRGGNPRPWDRSTTAAVPRPTRPPAPCRENSRRHGPPTLPGAAFCRRWARQVRHALCPAGPSHVLKRTSEDFGCGTWAVCTGSVSLGGSLERSPALGGSGSGVCGGALRWWRRTAATLRGAAAWGSARGPDGALMRGVRSGERNSRMVLLTFGSFWVIVSGVMASGVISGSAVLGRAGCMKVSGMSSRNAMAAACVSSDKTAERPMRARRPVRPNPSTDSVRLRREVLLQFPSGFQRPRDYFASALRFYQE